MAELQTKNFHLKKENTDLEFKNDNQLRQIFDLENTLRRLEDQHKITQQKLQKQKSRNQELVDDQEIKYCVSLNELKA